MNNEFEGADEVGFDLPAYFPVLTTLAQSSARARTLSALGELSFIAGRAGDQPADWEADIDGAIAEAFGALRPDRRARIKKIMREAFDAGVINYWIDRTEVPRDAMKLARAYALIHESEIQFECEREPSSNHCEAQDIAYKVACRRPVDGYQAAKASITALAELGLKCVPAWAEEVLKLGWRGEQQRAERHRMLNRQTAHTAFLDSIFDEEFGQ